ncbi:ATP-binding protein [Methylicorpusculum oleiharenae]|uniref:sensor histidine kinase n=1 Tax=Methylicorpusculum oleiharenae TaxID=1338687 RepID=UPI001E5AD95F|nr:ATP-binding protein [Methylicorpusculum oleiharenae]MCD2449526.1 ATP-binding protein [Methylicorpusculum oleiharenae]
MEQGQLQQVFEPFYRGHSLDLTIVNRLCNRLGGHLKISSKPGEGSRVRVGLFFPKTKRVGGRRLLIQ